MNPNNSIIIDERISTRLENISHYIAIYVSLFYLIVGNIGNVLKIFFFSQRYLRHCPCTVYVLFTTLIDFVTLNNIPMLILFSSLYPSSQSVYIGIGWALPMNGTLINSIEPSQKTIMICKIRNYIHMWSTDVSAQLLLFAAINRFSVSLKKNRRENRRLSSIFCRLSNACKISLITCVFWAIISLHHIFNFNITSNVCAPENILLWAVWLASIHCLFTLLMIIFGVLTLVNMRQYARFIRHRSHSTISRSSKRPNRRGIEKQLSAMIVTEALLTILTSLPYAIYVVVRLVTAKSRRTPRQMMYENFIELLVRFTMYFEPSCGFYVYLFSLKSLQKRFFNIMRSKFETNSLSL